MAGVLQQVKDVSEVEYERLAAEVRKTEKLVAQAALSYKLELVRDAERQLPALTGRVLSRLGVEHPGFLEDAQNEAGFLRYRKIFGVFKPKGYAPALQLLQARMARFLEQHERTTERTKQYGRELILKQDELRQLSKALIEERAVREALCGSSCMQGQGRVASVPGVSRGALSKKGGPVQEMARAQRPRQSECGESGVSVLEWDASDDETTQVSMRALRSIMESVQEGGLTYRSDSVTSHAVADGSRDRECALPAASSDIATDDSLGCFS